MDLSQDASPIALIVVIVVLSISTIIVALRIYTRMHLLKQLGLDDYCILVSLAFTIGLGATVLTTIRFGLGRHVSTVSATDIPKYLFTFWFSIVLYNVTTALIKLTFLCQYYRVLAVHQMKRVIWILGTFIMAWAISQICVVIFTCNPVSKFWQTDLPGTCIPNLPFWYINAAGNIVTDLAIFIMPLPVLNKLQLRRKQKYFLLGIFSLGFFTCAISLIRLAYLNQGPDFTFNNVSSACWSVSEMCCGISCACLPTLKPLMSKLKPHWIMSSATRQARRTGTGKLQYGKSGAEEGTELKNTHRSRTTRSSGKTLSTLNKNYTMIQEVDIEQGMLAPLSPTHRQPESGRHGSGDTSINEGTTAPVSWLGDDEHGVTKQSMPAVGISKETKALEILGMAGSVSTHVSSGKTPQSFMHPDSAGPPETVEPLTGIAVKRSVTVETIVTPTATSMRRTKPREF